ncbi:unnamed protein product [Closterium sp. Naga37s-1]|nr:unnamed protein product [Closterium sp. Naga37s-1]
MNDIPITIFGLHPSTTPPPSPPGSPEPSWMILLFKYLHVVPPDRIVAVSSSDNVVMLPSRHCEQQHLLESFLSLQSPVVFAANDRCAPSPSSSPSASSASSFFYKPHSADGAPNRFLNLGMFIGYAWALQRVLEVVVGSTQGHGSSGHAASASASAAAAAAVAGPAGAHVDAQRQLLLAFLAQDNIFSSLPRLPMDFPFANVTGTSKEGGDPAVGSGAADGAGGVLENQDAMAPPVTFASTALDNRFLPSSSDPFSSSPSSASSSSAAGAAVCAAFPAHPTAPSSSRPFISLDHQNQLFQVMGARGAAAPWSKEVEVVASGEDVRVKAEGTGGEACAFQQEDWVGGGGEGADMGVVRLTKDTLSALTFSTAVKGASLSTNRLAAAPAVVPRGLSVSALLGFNKTAVPAKATPAKKQLRTEDGIFGTSGGFGFTKANELFVGRVAMLGFAASLLGEAVTGQGILSQLNLETGIPITEAEPLLLFFIAFTVLGAIGGLGDRGRFVDDEAPAGPPVKPGSFKAALGLSEDGPLFGFTKANELFVGRMAQLGFAASLIGEVITGRGALAQLNIETGLPIFELEPLLLASIAFFFVAAINPGTGKFINDEE